MTDFNHKQASEQIAELYGVGSEIKWYDTDIDEHIFMYITQDLGLLMELAIRNWIDVVQYEALKKCATWDGELKTLSEEYYTDHNNDPIEATRVAIAKALIKKSC